MSGESLTHTFSESASENGDVGGAAQEETA